MDGKLATRGERIMKALLASAPCETHRTQAYNGRHKLLVMYGGGTEYRKKARATHVERGGRVVLWDLGYWDRDQSMRVSFDGLHPTPAQLDAVDPAGRDPERAPCELREDGDPDGFILLVGLGFKSVPAYGYQPDEWETAKLHDLRKRYPGRRILFRPKGREYTIAGLPMSYGNSIEQALQGCALVACRHSNVAVDACLAGVPAECDDGAARWLYRHGTTPGRELRAEFLRRLSWFNWHPQDARACWTFIEGMTA